MFLFKFIKLLINTVFLISINSDFFGNFEFIKLFSKVNSFFYSFINTDKFLLGLIFTEFFNWFESKAMISIINIYCNPSTALVTFSVNSFISLSYLSLFYSIAESYFSLSYLYVNILLINDLLIKRDYNIFHKTCLKYIHQFFDMYLTPNYRYFI